MPCTTILVGKNASYDGSTLMARNEDSGSGSLQTSTHSSNFEYSSSSGIVSSMALLLLPHAGNTVSKRRRESSS